MLLFSENITIVSFAMKYVKQMTIHEIAQQTSLSETNITTQLSRAYATLRSEISKQNP